MLEESILKLLLLFLHLLLNPTENLQKHSPFVLFMIETVGYDIIHVSLVLMTSPT